MNADQKNPAGWDEFLSPRKLAFLSINAVCFGACLVLLALGNASVPLILITIGTAGSFFSKLIGMMVALRKRAVIGEGR